MARWSWYYQALFKMIPQLQKMGVNKVIGGGCNCSSSHSAYTYILPFGLDSGIIEPMSQFGNSSTSFEKQALLKIENQDFSIVGVRRLKQIKIIIKNPNVSHLIDKFEEAIVQWLEKRSG